MSERHAQTVSYVRESMLDQQPPPITEKGVVKWLRDNLFSSWLNVILTVISLYVVYMALSLVLPWAFGGVWNAGSLTECREVLFSFYKTGHGGACWAVIEDRWLQLMFGFYPPEDYWRPILAFALFFLAIAPVLFSDKVPGQLIYFSFAYPFLAVWLVWGGAFWSPIFVAFGFVVGFLALKFVGKISGPIVANLAAIVAALVWWMVAMTPVSDGLYKLVGQSRFDATLADVEARAAELPGEMAEFEALEAAKQAEIASAVEEKNAILVAMTGTRIEEFSVEQQIEPKDDAFQRLDATQESIEDLAGLLATWGGAPVAASDSEADVAAADAATASIDDLIGDIDKFLSDTLSDITDNAVEPAEFAVELVPNAIQADPSIQDNVDAMVSKATLVDPLSDLVDRAATLSPATSQDYLASLRADTEIVMAAVTANLSSLNAIQDKVIATNADALKAPQQEMLEQMAVLTALRDDATELSQGEFRASTELSDGRTYLTALRSLAAREERLPELIAASDAAGDLLTSSQRGMINVNQLPADAPDEDVANLTAYLSAKGALVAAEDSVRATYQQLGRIGLTPIDSRQIGGFMLALIIGIAGIVLSLPLGVLLALGRQSHLFFVNKLCVTFIEVIRGVPLIVWLITASLLLNYFLPPGSNFDLMLRVIIMVTLFSAAYIAEVIRGGLAALPTGQYEGADSLGLSYWQSMQLIVLPQAMKISIPGIVNTFIGLFKDTTLVVFIGLLDPIGLSNAIRADTDWNGVYWELFVFIGALFFIFCFSMGRYSLHLEKKLQREHR